MHIAILLLINWAVKYNYDGVIHLTDSVVNLSASRYALPFNGMGLVLYYLIPHCHFNVIAINVCHPSFITSHLVYINRDTWCVIDVQLSKVTPSLLGGKKLPNWCPRHVNTEKCLATLTTFNDDDHSNPTQHM